MSSPEKIVKGLQLFEEAKAKHAARELVEAAGLYRRAIALVPNHPHMILGYAQLAEDLQDWSAAEILYRKLGELRPKSNFESKLAHALFKQERYAEAIPLFETCLARDPDDSGILHGLAIALGATGRWPESLATARRAAQLRPQPGVVDAELNAMYHMAMADELDARIDGELARFPDSRPIRSLYALHKLKSGDYENGFRFFRELRWRNNQKAWEACEAAGLISNDTWDGTPFDGVLLIEAEQGIGDEIMLSSMFDDLLATGQRVVVECDERLIPLYARSYPQLAFLARRQARDLGLPDGTVVKTITALDLSHVFRNGIGKFPPRPHWLAADPARRQAIHDAYRARWPGKRLVGISWKSTRIMEGGHKNVDLADLAAILGNRDCVFINLQYGDVADDIARAREAGFEVFVDPDVDTRNDIDGLAAQIAALDLVISTSNTTVHVAGALGVPCWLLLPKTKPILWYWGYRGERTPWYPSLRLVRNARDDDWRELAARVAADLAALPPSGP